MSKEFDRWLSLASEADVEVLQLCLHSDPDEDEEGWGECYVLPNGPIEAKSLTKLVFMAGKSELI
jgi:hypothetical protein